MSGQTKYTVAVVVAAVAAVVVGGGCGIRPLPN